MKTLTYRQRRGQLEAYFDRTASEAWARLTSDRPVSRIRETVRAGRDRMRARILDVLPVRSARPSGPRRRLRNRRPVGGRRPTRR